MSNRFVSAELLFQFQNAAIELAQKLGAAEARIAELNEQVSMMKSLANHSFGKLGAPPSPMYDPELSEKVTQTARDVMGDMVHRMRLGELRVSSMARQPGKSSMNSIHVIRELVVMVRQLTRPADTHGKGWMHPPLEYVQQCRERIKGLI